MRWLLSLAVSAFLCAQAQPSRAQEVHTVTAYCLQGVMRDGSYTRSGSVAADPRIHALGSTIAIEGLGEFIVRDTGGGVLGNHVDVWMPSCSDAVQFGRQYLVVERISE